MSNLLEVNHLSKTFKRFKLDDISFSLQPGKICGFVGINGAGKSTTIKLISRLLIPDNGQVLFNDKEVSEIESFERIGFVPDTCKLYETYTVDKAKKFISGFYKQWDEDEYNKYKEIFKLNGKKKIGELSKGMKMQFSLALALSHYAELLIMDEPTSGLDPYIRNQVLNILKDYISDGKKSVLFSTHLTSDLERVADQIVFIHAGKIIFSEEVTKLPDISKNILNKEWDSLDSFIIDYIDYLSKKGA